MTIELRNVSFRVGAETHIYETSLALEAGEFNILLGTTLAGKTSLMQLMAGLERPTSGEIWFDGERIDSLPPDPVGVSVFDVSLSRTTLSASGDCRIDVI